MHSGGELQARKASLEGRVEVETGLRDLPTEQRAYGSMCCDSVLWYRSLPMAALQQSLQKLCLLLAAPDCPIRRC